MLFVVFGWSKLTNFSGAVGYMTQTNVPMPSVAAVVVAIPLFCGGYTMFRVMSSNKSLERTREG